MPLINQHKQKIISFLFLSLSIYFQPANAEWFKAERDIMSAAIHVELWHANKITAEQNTQRVVNQMQRIDIQQS